MEPCIKAVRNAVLRLVRGMDLRLHPRSVAPVDGCEKTGPSSPTRAGSSCNNAVDSAQQVTPDTKQIQHDAMPREKPLRVHGII